MANTITDLMPDLFEALDVVSRELTGFIPAVSMDNQIARAAIGESVLIPITAAQTSAANTPAVYAPDTGDQTITNATIAITTSKHVPIRWNGEQTKGYSNNGLYSSTLAQQAAQGIRTLVNEIEADIADEAYRASRAVGTAGTTPFASSLSDANEARKVLMDNGAPMSDLSLVVNTMAGLNLRNLANLNQVNTSGTDMTLRNGVLLPLSGMDVRESAQINEHTKGTGASATTDATGYAIGATTLTLASAGTGTIVAGDVITIAGDTNKYTVLTGDADVSGGGTIVLAKPGLRVAITTSATAITILDTHMENLAFHRSAIHLATRMPAMPVNGDSAVDSQIITDERTGLSFEFALYPQFLQNSLHVRIAWGTKLIKPEHAVILMGE